MIKNYVTITMIIQSSPITSFLKKIFPEYCHERIFLVGGIVRDLLSGCKKNDIDLTAALTSQEFSSCGFKLVTGKTTSAIWFRHDDRYGNIEITPLINPGGLAVELARRDFTINAMAISLSGIIIDPLLGRSDHKQGLLQVCSDNALDNDPLRIFRALRFEADGWQLAAKTETLIRKRDWSKPLEGIPVERFTREMQKALESKYPERFFQRMLELRVGKNFLPELFSMPGVPAGPLIHHPEGDLFTHCCQVLQRVSTESHDPLTRFCAFFHDIGKLATNPEHYPKHHGHDQAGYVMAQSFCDRLRLPSVYRTALAWTSRLHGIMNLWDQLRDATRVRTAEEALKGGIAKILPIVSAADKADCVVSEDWFEAVRIAGMTSLELGIRITRLAELPPGKRSGLIFQKKVERFQIERVRSSAFLDPDPSLPLVP